MTYPKAKFLYLGSVQLDNEPIGIGFTEIQAVDIDAYRDKLFIPRLYGGWSANVELTAESTDLAVRGLNAWRRICEREGIIIGGAG